MKYSIIIVAYKDMTALRRCIHSVLASGIQDYEIIVMGNSCDGWNAPMDLEKRVRWYAAERNLGYAAGATIAANVAHGEFLIFLNPDCMVWGDWADRLAEAIEAGYAAAGPVSNFTAGHQQVERYGGRDQGLLEVSLLIGWCIMTRRSTFNSLGGFDPDLFLGCDDLDFSWRLSLAGERMAVVTGLFVYHEGHTSMQKNPDTKKLVEASGDAFRAKLLKHYGAGNVPSSEELFGCTIFATELRPQTVSLCMIVPSRTPEVEQMIASITCVDEVVCEEVGVVTDFAAARNKALARCTMDWVLWLDDDDELPPDSQALIRALLEKPGELTAMRACHFGFQVHNTGASGQDTQIFAQSRLFPRLEGLVWGGLAGCTGKVHETYGDNAERLGLVFVQTDIKLRHHGYRDEALNKAKQERNLALLHGEPLNAHREFNIATSFYVLMDFAQARAAYENALRQPDCTPMLGDTIRYMLAVICTQLGEWDKVPALIEGSRKPDAVFLAAKYCLVTGDEKKAAEFFRKYLDLGPISDPLGTNWPAFSAEARVTLAQLEGQE